MPLMPRLEALQTLWLHKGATKQSCFLGERGGGFGGAGGGGCTWKIRHPFHTRKLSRALDKP